MTNLKIWRKDFKEINLSKGYCGFNYYLSELGIKENLWPKIWLIIIYLQNPKYVELYNKQSEAIPQY